MMKGFATYLAGCFTVALLVASPETHRYLGMALIACFAAVVVLWPVPRRRR